MRTVAPTGAALLGPQDFLWWVAMMNNDHITAAASGSLVRIPVHASFTTGTVVDAHHNSVGYANKYGIYGAVVMKYDQYALVKIAGPAKVAFASPPTSVGQIAVINSNGTCTATDRAGVTDIRRVLGTVIETAAAGSLHTVAIGCSPFGSTDVAPVSIGGAAQRTKIACCVVDLSTVTVDTAYPCIGVSSVAREPGAGCGYAYGTPNGTITVGYAAGWFSSEPVVKASLQNAPQGIFVYDHTGGASWSHLMFRNKETIVPTTISGKLNVYAIGQGA